MSHPTPDPDYRAALEQLGTLYSPDLDAYASGRLPVAAVHCLMCESAPCECQARGLVFGSAAYFARLDAMHGRTPARPRRTCSAPECPATARVGEHPAGMAVSGSGGDSYACMVDVPPGGSRPADGAAAG